jgi:sec-independent protein translocase protein TatA
MTILTLLSAGHVVLIVFAVILLFGGKKIPELMKGIGQGINEFKKASKDNHDKDEENKMIDKG